MKLRSVPKILRDNSLALNRLGVKSLAVFGSTARNEASHSSDVDILVTFVLKPLVRAEVEKEAVYVA